VKPPDDQEREGNAAPPAEPGSVEVLAVLAVFYTLYLLRVIVVPVAFALILAILFAPAVRVLARWYIPAPVGALFVVALLGALTASAAYRLWSPAREWVDRVPAVLDNIEFRIRDLKAPVADVAAQAAEAGEQVERMASLSDPDRPEVELRPPGLVDAILTSARLRVGQAVVALVLLYLLLASRLAVVREILRGRLGTNGDDVEDMALDLESGISRYFATVIAINLVLGVVLGAVVYVIGMPNALLWGAMAAFLNFVPYVGALVGIAVLGAVALLTFDSLGLVFLTVFSYLALTSLEGLVVTPMILGRRMFMNPVVIFLSVVFWGMLWGVPGMLMAVPLLVIVKRLSERSRPLARVARIVNA
jgi:predicted PurR-regulated permease PerM